ncbi:hypothetical protein M9458_042069, partial [Cirrhinus mrigala]
QQLAAYVSWVNAQLRKKPGLKPVSDLRQDLRDGVVLAHLIEIVAGELLDGIHYVPCDDQERKQNVEKVLQFVSSKRIRMPQTSARDIVEGNLKSAMRLILALAAHFKPSASARVPLAPRPITDLIPPWPWLRMQQQHWQQPDRMPPAPAALFFI